MVERLTKNSSLVMVLKVNCLETFELTAQIKMIALKTLIDSKIMESDFDKFLVIKCQQARVWLGIVKLCSSGPLNVESFLDEVPSNVKSALTQEHLGYQISKLFYYDVDIVISSYLPMKQTEFLMVQPRGERLNTFDMTKLNFMP